jgi:NAD(P)-dependent dehydrogenase (short-subunit alcohol dehydrogenase family)
MSDYLELKGKRALVTGGTKGLAKRSSQLFREAGATVLPTDRSVSAPDRLRRAPRYVPRRKNNERQTDIT